MPKYDSLAFDPPAPVAIVSLRSPSDGSTATGVRLLIDTGADVTLLPGHADQSIVEVNEETKQYELQGFDGTINSAPVVRIEMHLLNKLFRGQFLVIGQEYGVLGRNVLNALSLSLDGPNLKWDER